MFCTQKAIEMCGVKIHAIIDAAVLHLRVIYIILDYILIISKVNVKFRHMCLKGQIINNTLSSDLTDFLFQIIFPKYIFLASVHILQINNLTRAFLPLIIKLTLYY